MNILICVLNFLLLTCGHNYKIPNESLAWSSVAEARAYVEFCLHENKVLTPNESLKDFLNRDDVKLALGRAKTHYKIDADIDDWLAILLNDKNLI